MAASHVTRSPSFPDMHRNRYSSLVEAYNARYRQAQESDSHQSSSQHERPRMFTTSSPPPHAPSSDAISVITISSSSANSPAPEPASKQQEMVVQVVIPSSSSLQQPTTSSSSSHHQIASSSSVRLNDDPQQPRKWNLRQRNDKPNYDLAQLLNLSIDDESLPSNHDSIQGLTQDAGRINNKAKVYPQEKILPIKLDKTIFKPPPPLLNPPVIHDNMWSIGKQSIGWESERPDRETAFMRKVDEALVKLDAESQGAIPPPSPPPPSAAPTQGTSKLSRSWFNKVSRAQPRSRISKHLEATTANDILKLVTFSKLNMAIRRYRPHFQAQNQFLDVLVEMAREDEKSIENLVRRYKQLARAEKGLDPESEEDEDAQSQAVSIGNAAMTDISNAQPPAQGLSAIAAGKQKEGGTFLEVVIPQAPRRRQQGSDDEAMPQRKKPRHNMTVPESSDADDRRMPNSQVGIQGVSQWYKPAPAEKPRDPTPTQDEESVIGSQLAPNTQVGIRGISQWYRPAEPSASPEQETGSDTTRTEQSPEQETGSDTSRREQDETEAWPERESTISATSESESTPPTQNAGWKGISQWYTHRSDEPVNQSKLDKFLTKPAPKEPEATPSTSHQSPYNTSRTRSVPAVVILQSDNRRHPSKLFLSDDDDDDELAPDTERRNTTVYVDLTLDDDDD